MKKIRLLIIMVVVVGLTITSVSGQYTAIDNTTMSQTWIYSRATENMPTWLTTTAFQKGLAFNDGKLFVADAYSEGRYNRVIVLNSLTGDSIASLYVPEGAKGVNANSYISVIDIDAVGNLYACNLQTTAQTAGKEFLVYRWAYDPETKTYGTGTIFMEYSFAGNTDVTGNIE